MVLIMIKFNLLKIEIILNAHKTIIKKKKNMLGVGFEPTLSYEPELKSGALDRSANLARLQRSEISLYELLLLFNNINC